jgi:leucine dehydrogenase
VRFRAPLNEEKLNEVGTKYNAQILEGTICTVLMLIFMRLVLATINNDTVYKLKAKVIAGAANNQLADENVHGAILQEAYFMHLIS